MVTRKKKTEPEYQAELIPRIKARFPGCIVLKNDSSYIQGIPDLSVLWYGHWAFLEVKRSEEEYINDQQPNQEYYVECAKAMCFGAFIFPENEEVVLNAMEQSFNL